MGRWRDGARTMRRVRVACQDVATVVARRVKASGLPPGRCATAAALVDFADAAHSGGVRAGPPSRCSPLALVLVALAACEAGPPPVTPAPIAGTPDDTARGQPHREGLLVPPRHARPGPGRDRPAPRRQRRPRDPRGGHRRCGGPGRLGGGRGGARRRAARPDAGRQRAARGRGLRVVVRSGERVDVRWTVPDAVAGRTPPRPGDWIVGCHIPGHLDKGMLDPGPLGRGARLREAGRWYALHPQRRVTRAASTSRRT